MLHTVNQSPFESTQIETCLRYLSDNDALVLMENGVTAALANTTKSHYIEGAIKHAAIYVIQADVEARGYQTLIKGVNIIDYAGFVALVEQHPVKNWV